MKIFLMAHENIMELVVSPCIGSYHIYGEMWRAIMGEIALLVRDLKHYRQICHGGEEEFWYHRWPSSSEVCSMFDQ